MKQFIVKLSLLTGLILMLSSSGINSQQSQNLFQDCSQQFGNNFVHNGQPMRALLTGAEVAEFRTTMFEGNTYRITTCTPGDQKIWFSVYDTNNNLLFSSSRHDHTNTWDFKMEGNMECIIEAGLRPESGDSGMALVMIGFKSSSNKN
jgi:hypothetical protein